MPPWLDVRVHQAATSLTDGSRAEFDVPAGPFHRRWVAEHRGYQPGVQFQDVQLRGPFRSWSHVHRFLEGPGSTSILEDEVTYALPLAPVSHWFAGWFARKSIRRMFAYRHAVTRGDLAQHAHYQETAPMHIAISGSSGLVGTALRPYLETAGHTTAPLVRTKPGAPAPTDGIAWIPEQGVPDLGALEGMDAVIHLAGESIAEGRWNDAKKARIRDSRVAATAKLATSLAAMDTPPKTLVVASAIGIYGNRGDEPLPEDSAPGSDFLAEVCKDWEAAAEPARKAGIRVVHVRFGVILSPKGGALKKMLLPFKLGAGGKIGSGTQYMSWVALDDVLGAIQHVLATDAIQGPVNVTAPNPVTNREYTKTLGRVLWRPTIIPMPGFLARLAFGEVADALLLASQRTVPGVLERTGYQFRHPQLEPALRHMLGKADPKPE
jgi:uncharacterized protein (TIGR01777 family)